MNKLFVAIFFALNFISCENHSVKEVPDGNNKERVSKEEGILKIYVRANGEITENGIVMPIDSLGAHFLQLKSVNGVIYYSRENLNEEPHENAMKVMELIVKNGLPIQFYTDEYFTTPAQMQ